MEKEQVVKVLEQAMVHIHHANIAAINLTRAIESRRSLGHDADMRQSLYDPAVDEMMDELCTRSAKAYDTLYGILEEVKYSVPDDAAGQTCDR